MKEIVNILHENRQIEKAKSILESAGYKVSKKLKEGFTLPDGHDFPTAAEILADSDMYDEEVIEEVNTAVDLLGVSAESIYLVTDENYPYQPIYDIINNTEWDTIKTVNTEDSKLTLFKSKDGKSYVEAIQGSGHTYFTTTYITV